MSLEEWYDFYLPAFALHNISSDYIRCFVISSFYQHVRLHKCN